MRGKREGDMASSRYNSELQLNTIRWAMIAPLRDPPAGFKEVHSAVRSSTAWFRVAGPGFRVYRPRCRVTGPGLGLLAQA
jgi:hypothetical protein